MFELAVARVHVEIEAADQHAVAVHFMGGDACVPDRRAFPGGDLDAEQVFDQREDAGPDIVIGEILADLLRIEGVVRLADLFGEIGAAPFGNRIGIRFGLNALGEEALVFDARGIGCGRFDAGQEGLGHFR